MASKNNILATYFSKTGLLAKHLPSFESRSAQLEMAAAMMQALTEKKDLVCEAPTGIGKTYAYLIPILKSPGKAIISTASKTLQNQLFHRDLPFLLRFPELKRTVALLKGRANYLCLYRLENAFLEQAAFDRKTAEGFMAINQWAATTQTGDIAECLTIDDNAPVWRHVTSTSDNCLAKECPMIGQCHLYQARKKAQEADIIVVNHHLLFSQYQLVEEGIDDLLPEVDTICLDEAHSAAEIAAQFFSVSLSTNQFINLVQDILIERDKDASDDLTLQDAADALSAACKTFASQLQHVDKKGLWQTVYQQKVIKEGLQHLWENIEHCIEALEEASARSKGLESCYERIVHLSQRFQKVFKNNDTTDIHWYEVFKSSVQVNLTPLTIAEPFQSFQKAMAKHWLFTSATLTANQSFAFFKKELGLAEHTTELSLPTPFDYAAQGVLYSPRYLANPTESNYSEDCVQAALRVIELTKGRTFFLFTSHKALNHAATVFATLDYPLFVQGSASRNELLEQFQVSGRGVLLGTSSFWEGVDIRGDALMCVIIDRLPFSVPDDPVQQARLQHYRTLGQDPFTTYQLPKAGILLKQGAGRLIRSGRDKGILMVCDGRLVSKQYGQIFLGSLPDFKRTRDLETVRAVLQEWESA